VGFAAARPVVRWVVTWSDNLSPGPGAQLAVLLFLAFVFGAFTDWIGLEAVLGVFVMGIMVGKVPRLRIDAVHSLDLIVSSFLAPIYFGLAGLRVDLWSLLHWNTLLILLAVMAVACLGKCAGVYLGAWVGGASHWERLSMSFGLNARGAMEIVVATVGLSLGVFNFQIYSVIVVMAVATALMAGPTMRWALSHVVVSRAEGERLESEQATAKSFVRRLRRVLLPSWGGAGIREGARLIALLHKGQAVEATALFVGNAAGDDAFEGLSGSGVGGPVYGKKVVSGKDIAQAILAEAQKAYDVILLGASERSDRTMDALIRSAPCPTLVVRPARSASPAIKNILVYTDGGKACSQAVELAARWAAAAGARLTVLYVADLLEGLDLQTDAYEARQRLTQEIVDAHGNLARKLDATVDALVVEAVRPDAGILLEAYDKECELIVLTGSVLPTTGRPFLGSLVANVFREATCTVAVLNA
jgi:nucleotide-binding universal stress UspA family protein